MRLQVLNLDDRLELQNTSGKTVVVKGYQGEPYARLLGDGTVEVNHNSPAFYLNNDRTSTGTVPANAKPGATPDWQVVDRAGSFQWHDHRIHWMSTITPKQVTDKTKRTKIFDWKVPLQVGAHERRGQRHAVLGRHRRRRARRRVRRPRASSRCSASAPSSSSAAVAAARRARRRHRGRGVVRALLLALRRALALAAPGGERARDARGDDPRARRGREGRAARRSSSASTSPSRAPSARSASSTPRARASTTTTSAIPAARATKIAVGLRSGLAHGAYTATYRVVSADGHTVSGGFVFDIGAAGAAAGASVADLLDGARSGTADGVRR